MLITPESLLPQKRARMFVLTNPPADSGFVVLFRLFCFVGAQESQLSNIPLQLHF